MRRHPDGWQSTFNSLVRQHLNRIAVLPTTGFCSPSGFRGTKLGWSEPICPRIDAAWCQRRFKTHSFV